MRYICHEILRFALTTAVLSLVFRFHFKTTNDSKQQHQTKTVQSAKYLAFLQMAKTQISNFNSQRSSTTGIRNTGLIQ